MVQFFAVGQAVILVINACIGDLGKHQPLDANGQAIPSPKLMTFQELEYSSFLAFTLALLFAKLSVLHLYNHLFHVEPAFRIAVIVTYVLNVAWGVAFFFGYIFKCWPITDYWMTANGTGHCLHYTFNYAFAISNVILDVLILIMPLPVVWSLRMAWRQKLAVSGIFLLGSLVVVLSIVKAVAFYLTLEWVKHDNDFMFDEAPLFYYSVPEALVAVTSACLPTLKPLFSKMVAPLSSQMSQTRASASITANKSIGRLQSSVELSPRGFPARSSPEAQRSCTSPAGLGRDHGLGVDRRSLAGGVMWQWYTRRGRGLEEQKGYLPWQRDSEYYDNDLSLPKSSRHASSSGPPSSFSVDEERTVGLGINTSAARPVPEPPAPTFRTNAPPPISMPRVAAARSTPSPLGRLAWQASFVDESRTSNATGQRASWEQAAPTQPADWMDEPTWAPAAHRVYGAER